MQRIIQKNLAVYLCIAYTLLMFYWMVLGFGRTTHPQYMYNLKPFFTIRHFLEVDRVNVNVWIINLIGNIGVFVPFGILLPLICKGKLIKSYLVFLSGLILLESIQLLSRRGSLDIDDIILNTVGFMIGFGFYRIIKGWLK